MISIFLNGSEYQLAPSTTISDLLRQLELAEKRVAVEVNQAILPRSRHTEYAIRADDKIEIVHAIGGG